MDMKLEKELSELYHKQNKGESYGSWCYKKGIIDTQKRILFESDILNETLLMYLVCNGYDPEDYLNLLEYIEIAEADKKELEEHPEIERSEEAEYIDDDIEMWKKEISEINAGWVSQKNKSEIELRMKDEIAIIKLWIKLSSLDQFEIKGDRI